MVLATNGGTVPPQFAGSDKHVAELATDLAHLPTSSVGDAVHLLRDTKWDLLSIYAEDLILLPQNAAYRIELFKRLTAFSPDFLVPWIVKHLLKKTEGVDSFDIDVFGDAEESEHLKWAAVNALVSRRMYNVLKDADIGYLREPVEAANDLWLGSNESDAAAICNIIRVRRVYKVEEIEVLLTGGTALREGAL